MGLSLPGLGIGDQHDEMHGCLGSAAVLVTTCLAWLLCHWHCWVFTEALRTPESSVGRRILSIHQDTDCLTAMALHEFLCP